MYRSTRRVLQTTAAATLLSLCLTGCTSLTPVPETENVWDQGPGRVHEAAPPAEPKVIRTHPPAPATPEPSTTAEAPDVPEVEAADPVETEESPHSDEDTTSRSAARAPVADPAPAATTKPTPSADPTTPAPTLREPAATTPHSGPFGVTDSAALTPRGDGTIREDGAVIENAVITGTLILAGDNQRVRNVRVEGGVVVRGTGTVIEDSDVGAFVVSGGKDVVATRLNIFGLSGADGIHVTSDTGRVQNVLIQDSRIHSPRVTSTSHYDGIQVRGVDGLTLRGNSFELGPYKPQFTAAIFLENANGGNTNVTVEGNYIDGGGFAVYLGGKNTRFVNNTFGSSAGFGILYPNSDMSSVTTSGNIGPDGKPLKL